MLNIARKRRTFLAHTSVALKISRPRGSAASLTRAATCDFAIELLSSRKKYVAKYHRDICRYSRRFKSRGQIYDREMADSSKVSLNRRVFAYDSSCSREYRVVPLVHSVNREGRFYSRSWDKDNLAPSSVNKASSATVTPCCITDGDEIA